MQKGMLKSAALALLWTSSAFAGTAIFDFNTNPDGVLNFTGVVNDTTPRTLAEAWHDTGGITNSGYLSITDAIGGSRSTIIFDDFDSGMIVQAFDFECDLRIGDGTAEPADGFSVNYVRANDPVLTGGAFATGQNCEANLPEEGTQTGISIGFDAWNSGGTAGSLCNVADQSIGVDVMAVTVRVDGTLVAQFPMPLRNGDCADATSLQTGPRDTVTPGSASTLCWAKLKVQLTTGGALNVWWKGVQLLNNYQTTYFPSAGRLIFTGRTGGSHQNQHVDNISITTIPAADLLVGAGAATPIGVSMTVNDSGNTVANTNTIQMKMDDVVVTPTYVAKTNSTTYVAFWDVTKPLVAGSSHTVALSIQDNASKTVAATNTVTVPAYVAIPVAYAANNVDTTKPGFAVKAHWAPAEDADIGYTMENSISRAEQQLAGLRGTNRLAGSAGATLNITTTGVINYSFDVVSATDVSIAQQGAFRTNTANPGGPDDWPDTNPWGIAPAGDSANPSDTSNIAAAMETYIVFPEAGVYRLIFNSDDGFRTTSGPNPSDIVSSINVSQADVGRGSSDTAVTLYIAQAGAYPFRTVWFQGGGGANLEWSADEQLPHPTTRRLLNDDRNPEALKTYSARTANTMPAAISFIQPARGSGGPFLGNVPVQIELTAGASPVDQNSIVLKFDNATVTPVITPSGSKTKVVYQPPTLLASGSTHTFDIAFTSGGTSYAATNTFTVADYITLPPSLALPATAVDKAKTGFWIKTVQMDYDIGWNTSTRANYHVDGLLGWPNVADFSLFPTINAQGYIASMDYFIDTINFNGWSSAGGKFAAANYAEYNIPGIPSAAAHESGRDDFSQEILTVLELKAGWYNMGVTSDDGCQVTFGNPKEKYSLSLNRNTADVGRGMDDGTDVGYFYVQQDGLYPTRLVWEQGGGGAGCEWYLHDIVPGYSASGVGTRRLINDTSDPNILNKIALAYQYPLEHPGVPYLAYYGPARKGLGNHTAYDASVTASIVDAGGNIDIGTVSLVVDGASVTPIKSKVAGVTSVSYKPANNWTPGDHTVALTFGDRTVNWTFSVAANATITPVFWVEAEDYDYASGQTEPAASQMPYLGGAYAGQDGVNNIDYARGDEGSTGNKYYRNVSVVPRVPEQFNEGDRDRGAIATSVNTRLGWIGAGQWYNYTRTLPAGKYNVYAAASHGSATEQHGEYALLRKVTSGQGTATQTTEVLGIFDAVGTGGWGLNTWVPLKDLDGNLVALDMTGAPVTFRYDLPNNGTSFTLNGKTGTSLGGNGDWDYMVFTPAVAGKPVITKVEQVGSNIVITWSNGTVLEASPDLQTWAEVTGVTSPATIAITPDKPIRFFRVRQ
jgi:hypothetical protein